MPQASTAPSSADEQPARAVSLAAGEILREHCLVCHGPEKQAGELRLDAAEHLARGGHSGNPLITDSLDTSELFLRVSSDDPEYRMPRDAPPLDPTQVETLRRWIAGGGRWLPAENVPRESGAVGETPGTAARASTGLGQLLDWLEKATRPLRPLIVPLLLCLVGIWWLEQQRRRQTVAGKSTAANGSLPAGRVSRWSYLLVAVAFVLAGLWLRERHDLREARDEIAQLQRSVRATSPANALPAARSELGGPLPHRPKHPRRLGGVYYRGNDERDPRLFNGGFYRTADFRLWLADGEHRELQWGSPLPDGDLWIGLQIVRAPLATPQLFTPRIMETVFLSRQFQSARGIVGADAPIRLETLEPGERWQALYPIGNLREAADGCLAGVVYLYKAREPQQTADAKFHFGIRYNLRADGLSISRDSELWMGALALPFGVSPPREGGLTHDEWFDFRPIPQIDGENSRDPGLLGIPEYVQDDASPAQESNDAQK